MSTRWQLLTHIPKPITITKYTTITPTSAPSIFPIVPVPEDIFTAWLSISIKCVLNYSTDCLFPGKKVSFTQVRAEVQCWEPGGCVVSESCCQSALSLIYALPRGSNHRQTPCSTTQKSLKQTYSYVIENMCHRLRRVFLQDICFQFLY